MIRSATIDDVPSILGFIRALAEYEKLLSAVTATEDLLRRNLFGPGARAEVLLIEEDGVLVGFALFFTSFSTFLGKPGIYLEDLFISPEHRGRGFGERLLIHLARLAVERDCGRLEWSVLDWNTPALRFYERLGAERMTEWTGHRLSGGPLLALASSSLEIE